MDWLHNKSNKIACLLISIWDLLFKIGQKFFVDFNTLDQVQHLKVLQMLSLIT